MTRFVWPYQDRSIDVVFVNTEPGVLALGEDGISSVRVENRTYHLPGAQVKISEDTSVRLNAPTVTFGGGRANKDVPEPMLSGIRGAVETAARRAARLNNGLFGVVEARHSAQQRAAWRTAGLRAKSVQVAAQLAEQQRKIQVAEQNWLKRRASLTAELDELTAKQGRLQVALAGA